MKSFQQFPTFFWRPNGINKRNTVKAKYLVKGGLQTQQLGEFEQRQVTVLVLRLKIELHQFSFFYSNKSIGTIFKERERVIKSQNSKCFDRDVKATGTQYKRLRLLWTYFYVGIRCRISPHL
jgi:hypothetical protein